MGIGPWHNRTLHQLESTAGDPDRACRVACQDSTVSHRWSTIHTPTPACRFYMVTGEKGWLPYGTDCSGEARREAYCVKGRCLEFGGDGTPLYEPGPGEQPRFRRALVTGEEVPMEEVLWREGRARRSLMLNSTRVAGSIDQEYLREIVRDFNRYILTPSLNPAIC